MNQNDSPKFVFWADIASRDSGNQCRYVVELKPGSGASAPSVHQMVESESEFGEQILVAVAIDGVGQGLARLSEEVMSTEHLEHVQCLLSSGAAASGARLDRPPIPPEPSRRTFVKPGGVTPFGSGMSLGRTRRHSATVICDCILQ